MENRLKGCSRSSEGPAVIVQAGDGPQERFTAVVQAQDPGGSDQGGQSGQTPPRVRGWR